MSKRVGLVVLGVLGLCSVAWAAAPAAPTFGPGGFPGAHTPLGRLISGSIGRLMVLRSDLALTDVQRMQVRELLVQHRAEIAATVKSVRDCRVELRDMVLRGDADEATIKAAADKLGTAIGDAAVKATKLRNDLAPILTDEQKARLREFVANQDGAVDKLLEQAAQGK
jgi:Spy/CpxP family protein refolding chaperone